MTFSFFYGDKAVFLISKTDQLRKRLRRHHKGNILAVIFVNGNGFHDNVLIGEAAFGIYLYILYLEDNIESVDDLPPMELMSYQTIRDMENSLREAAGGEDKQITIDSIMGGAKPESEETEEEEDNGND